LHISGEIAFPTLHEKIEQLLLKHHVQKVKEYELYALLELAVAKTVMM
jgi:hypothetical protein